MFIWFRIRIQQANRGLVANHCLSTRYRILCDISSGLIQIRMYKGKNLSAEYKMSTMRAVRGRAHIKHRRFLDNEKLIRSEQSAVPEEIFNANFRDTEIRKWRNPWSSTIHKFQGSTPSFTLWLTIRISLSFEYLVTLIYIKFSSK